MKKILFLFIPLFIVMQSCLDEPDPGPETVHAPLIIYNNFLEPFSINWEADGEELLNQQEYGLPAQGAVEIENMTREVEFRAKSSDDGTILDSLRCELNIYSYYALVLMGSTEDPFLRCDTMDLFRPTTGMTKIRFLNAAESLGNVDIYIGGSDPEHKLFSSLEFTQFSDYVEVSDMEIWEAIIISPENTDPSDSTILFYEANTALISNRTYLGLLNHSDNTAEASFRLQVFQQPTY